MDKKTFRITKVTAKVKKKTCEICGEQISRGHKVAIAGTYYCDRCVVAGFLENKARNRGFFTRLHARLVRADEAIEVERYIEKRSQRNIVVLDTTAKTSQPEMVKHSLEDINHNINQSN